jgi:hypothetical protein
MLDYSTWKGKTENDLLECLEEAFNNAGHSVYNLHKHDRSHEEGVDMECQKAKEKTLLQAKLRPAKKDLKQLKKLARSEADKRIYIYAENPSVSFRKGMKDLESHVEFWNAQKLHDFLINCRSLSYLRFLFLDSELVKNIREVLRGIFSCCEVSPQELESDILNDWWEFKDRTVKVHASLEYLEDFWKDRIFTIDKHDTAEYRRVLESIFFSFRLISKHSSQDLVDLVRMIKGSHPGIFSKYVNVVLDRSNWIGMGETARQIRNEDKANESISEWVVPQLGSGSEYSQIHSYLENLHEVAEAVEDGVDGLFDDYLKSQNLPTLK